jgi:phosphatidylserine decarboxylase
VITSLEAGAFGKVLILEIGATCVGGIHQTFRAGSTAGKGSEKGYFSFGGSSVITLFEPGRIVLTDDLLESSAKGIELYARFGTPMARLARGNA